MKKKTSHSKAYLLLCLFFATPIIATMFTDVALHLGKFTVFMGKMPENPPEGISISVGYNPSRSIRYTNKYSGIDSLRQSQSDSIPYLTEILHGSKNSPQVQEVTPCHWDTLYIVKPHCTYESLGMAKVSRELEEKIGQHGPEDDTCLLVFWNKGEIVQYASVLNKEYDFSQAPNILTHGITYNTQTFGLGNLCINRIKTVHSYR